MHMQIRDSIIKEPMPGRTRVQCRYLQPNRELNQQHRQGLKEQHEGFQQPWTEERKQSLQVGVVLGRSM